VLILIANGARPRRNIHREWCSCQRTVPNAHANSTTVYLHVKSGVHVHERIAESVYNPHVIRVSRRGGEAVSQCRGDEISEYASEECRMAAWGNN
jgi:hypothetical protein